MFCRQRYRILRRIIIVWNYRGLTLLQQNWALQTLNVFIFYSYLGQEETRNLLPWCKTSHASAASPQAAVSSISIFPVLYMYIHKKKWNMPPLNGICRPPVTEAEAKAILPRMKARRVSEVPSSQSVSLSICFVLSSCYACTCTCRELIFNVHVCCIF